MKSSDVFFEDLCAAVKPANLVKSHFSQNSGLIGAAAYGLHPDKVKFVVLLK